MHYNCWQLRCSWSIACRRCSNYIWVIYLTPVFNGLGKDNCKTRCETFKWNFTVCVFRNVENISIIQIFEKVIPDIVSSHFESYDCPSANEITIRQMGKYNMWITHKLMILPKIPKNTTKPLAFFFGFTVRMFAWIYRICDDILAPLIDGFLVPMAFW